MKSEEFTTRLRDTLTCLTYYIAQMEHPEPERLLNPIYLWPPRGHSQTETYVQNEKLRDEAIALLHELEIPFFLDLRY